MRITGLLYTTLVPTLTLALNSAVYATALSDVSTSATLTIDSISSDAGDLANLLINGEGFVLDQDASATGGASAFANGTALPAGLTALGINDAIELNATTSDSANSSGTSNSLFLTDGEMALENLSTFATFTIGLSFDYALSVAASVDNLVDEFATALGAVSLESDLIGDFLINELVEIDTSINPLDSPISISDTLMFDVILTPGEAETLFLISDAESTTSSSAVAVSSPASAALLLLGLAGMGLRRLRR